VQDEESSSVYGMSGEAWALGGVDLLAPAEKIPEIILDWTKKSIKHSR
jgi:chemotaxis response regulator CheB